MSGDAVYIEVPPFYLNQSRWKTFQDCDRLYGWFHVEGLEPDRPRKPLVIGTAIHKAQVAVHSKGFDPATVEEATKKATEFFTKAMNRGIQLPGDQAEILEGQKTIQKLLPAYYRHWGALGQVWKPLGLELSFCVEVGEGTNVWLVGTIDNLVTLNNSLWLVDYKTMGKLDMREFLKYEIDIQLTAYIYGGTKQLSIDAKKLGKPPVIIRGAIIDGMVKTLIPQFHREIYTRSIDDLREFELEFCMKAWEIAAKHALVQGDREKYDAYTTKMWELGRAGGWKVVFPKNTQHCFRYGTCSHRDLCVADTDVRRMSFRKRVPDYVDDARSARDKASESQEPQVAEPPMPTTGKIDGVEDGENG